MRPRKKIDTWVGAIEKIKICIREYNKFLNKLNNIYAIYSIGIYGMYDMLCNAITQNVIGKLPTYMYVYISI